MENVAAWLYILVLHANLEGATFCVTSSLSFFLPNKWEKNVFIKNSINFSIYKILLDVKVLQMK